MESSKLLTQSGNESTYSLKLPHRSVYVGTSDCMQTDRDGVLTLQSSRIEKDLSDLPVFVHPDTPLRTYEGQINILSPLGVLSSVM